MGTRLSRDPNNILALRIQSVDDLIELLQFCLRNQIHLVDDNDICKLNLIH